MWISFRARLTSIVGAITVAWLLLIAGSTWLAMRQTQVLTDVEERMVPRLELAPKLRLHFNQLSRSLEYAVLAHDGDALRTAAADRDALIDTIAASSRYLDPADSASLRSAIQDYYVTAENVARKLAVSPTDGIRESLGPEIQTMQSKEARAAEILQRTTAFDRNELASAFVNIRERITELHRFRIVIGIGGLIAVLGLSVWFSRGVLRTVEQISTGFARFGKGDFSEPIAVSTADELGKVAREANKMAASLSRLARERDRNDWIKAGSVGLSDRLRGELEPSEASERALRYLLERVGAVAGAVYLLERDGTLALWCRYATPVSGDASEGENASKPLERFRPGEGLVGRAAQNEDILVIEDIPPGYLIPSGLGAAPPRSLVFVPLTRGGVTMGIIELALFQELSADARELLETAREGLAISLDAARSRAALRDLLEETQRQAELLSSREAQLRSSNQELRRQQEELRQANEELESQRAALNEQNTELEEARETVQSKVEELAKVSSFKSQFLSNMSHELRTPLNSMLLLSHLLAENEPGNLTPKQVEHARTIHGAGKDLLELINQVLDLAKIEAGKQEVLLETVSLDHLEGHCRKIFTPFAEEKGLRFTIEREPGLPAAMVTDRQRAERILTNLIGNAIKFTEQGEVKLRIHRPKASVRFGRADLPPAKAIAFAVSDTGMGIGPESQERVFLPFEQLESHSRRRYAGTGLGLAIARESARLLGGELHLESARGRGSTFTCYLPERHPAGVTDAGSAQAKALEQHPSDDRDAVATNEAHLLVIEDDVDLAEQLVELIHARGFKAILARSGEEGLALARQRLPHGIILDVKLPDIDGREVLERLHNDPTTREVPVHFLSALDRAEQGLALGAIGYLTKPVTREDLLGVVQTLTPPATEKRRRILVVEDDSAVGESTVELLAAHGFDAHCVNTANAAISALETNEFGCIILDLGLPDVDGLDLLQRLKKRVDIEPPRVVVHTGRALTKREARELEEYAQAVVMKDGRSAERLLEEIRLFVGHVREGLPDGAVPTAESATDIRIDGSKILIADDDMRTVYAISALLRGKGAEVLVADTGAEALEVLEKTPGVDAVLMDVMMPEMDGYEAMRRIRQNRRFLQLPIVALTARAMKGERERCLEAGATDYLSKPVDGARLLTTLEQWLRRRSSRGC